MVGFFGLLAGVIGLIAYLPYIRAILRHRARPDRASWLIWTLEYLVLFSAQAAQGVAASLWLVGLQTLGVITVFGLSFRYGMGGLDGRSVVLLGCVCLALTGWYFTNASMAIVIALAVEAVGVALTAVKAYRHPGSEPLTFWVLVGTAGVLGVPAAGVHASAIIYVYPVSLAVMSACVIAAATAGRRRSHAGTAAPERLLATSD